VTTSIPAIIAMRIIRKTRRDSFNDLDVAAGGRAVYFISILGSD